jgi:hypothetical protein
MKADLLAKLAAMKANKVTAVQTPSPEPQQTPSEAELIVAEPIPLEVETNLQETPKLLRQLLGIVETIEESDDNSETALLKASEQVEKCRAYIVYLQSILPILNAKVDAMIEAKHKPSVMRITQNGDFKMN